jgi:hypothetical protein
LWREWEVGLETAKALREFPFYGSVVFPSFPSLVSWCSFWLCARILHLYWVRFGAERLVENWFGETVSVASSVTVVSEEDSSFLCKHFLLSPSLRWPPVALAVPLSKLVQEWGRVIKEREIGVDSTMMYFKNFCKCHSIPPVQQ